MGDARSASRPGRPLRRAARRWSASAAVERIVSERKRRAGDEQADTVGQADDPDGVQHAIAVSEQRPGEQEEGSERSSEDPEAAPSSLALVVVDRPLLRQRQLTS
jgi:hypothetical protein